MAWLEAPLDEWAVPEMCGDFPCSGPLNALFYFKRTKFSKMKPAFATSDFEIIPNNQGFSNNLQSCTESKVMNAFTCEEDSLGLL
mmetsp:Transcript_36043/g.55352  ORF Transcript_36043/g.55352 Transcript_36043/m.55352 type:complete len:85 (+) Transcript_36043:3451-3705(+)